MELGSSDYSVIFVLRVKPGVAWDVELDEKHGLKVPRIHPSDGKEPFGHSTRCDGLVKTACIT